MSLLTWLAISVAFVVWSALRTFHVGRMPLPRSQAVALALCLVTLVSLTGCWLQLGWRLLANRLGWRRQAPRDWLDHRLARAALLSLLLLTAALIPYGRYVEPLWIAVKPVALGGPLPAGRRAVRLAVISDLHVEGAGPPWDGLARHVNGTDPDVVLLLGDTLNRAAGLKQLHRTLTAIRARRAKLAVRGNWERWYWAEQPLLRGTGFHWLDGRKSMRIAGQRIHFVGLGYRDDGPPGRRSPGRRSPGRRAQRLLASAGQGWRILLYHTPDLAQQVPSADLYLAGHTHGGQVALPLFGALVTLSRHGKRFERGLSWRGRTAIYVNPGIGVEPMIPLRIGVRPEVTLVRLGAPPRAAAVKK